MKRRKPHGAKRSSAAETTPDDLAETWKVVEEELKATGLQVSVRINLKGRRSCGFKEPQGLPEGCSVKDKQ